MALSTVQSAFNKTFPYLKLEFFKHSHKVHGGNPKKDMLSPGHILRISAKDLHEAEILVSSEMTVALLERLFRDRFGLNAQVFRKSGTVWLETTLTDDWSLSKQNNEGFELSTFS